MAVEKGEEGTLLLLFLLFSTFWNHRRRSDHGLSEAGLRKGKLNNRTGVEKVKSTEEVFPTDLASFGESITGLKISTNTPPPEDESWR